MNDKITAVKYAITAVFAASSAFLGWRGIVALVWVAMMIMDYISGSIAAAHRGEWSSSVARSGILHKIGMVFAVGVAALADLAICATLEYCAMPFDWPNLLLPLVLVWYILTEAGSVLENAVKLGAPVPPWLVKILRDTADAVDPGEK